MKKAVFIAILSLLALSGCSNNGVALDRATSIENMTIMVPSDWIEQRNTVYTGEGELFHFYPDGDDTTPVISVFCGDPDNLNVDDEIMAYEGVDDLSLLEGSLICDGVVDGSKYASYQYDYGGEVSWTITFVDNVDHDFEITINGDTIDTESLVESIRFTS